VPVVAGGKVAGREQSGLWLDKRSYTRHRDI
jgi:hypothetical protein